jgi:hypothetical protein
MDTIGHPLRLCKSPLSLNQGSRAPPAPSLLVKALKINSEPRGEIHMNTEGRVIHVFELIAHRKIEIALNPGNAEEGQIICGSRRASGFFMLGVFNSAFHSIC